MSPSFANSTYDAVAGSLQKRQLQVQELKAKLEASQDAGTALRQKARFYLPDERRSVEKHNSECKI